MRQALVVVVGENRGVVVVDEEGFQKGGLLDDFVDDEIGGRRQRRGGGRGRRGGGGRGGRVGENGGGI